MTSQLDVYNHPTDEELIDYLTKNSRSSQQVKDHVEDCLVCHNELKALENLLGDLKVVFPVDRQGSDCAKHLSDELINDYVYGRLNDKEVQSTVAHLDQCTVCRKEVLLLQTAIAQRNVAGSHVNTVQSFTRTSPVRRSILPMSLAAAASILIAIILIFQKTSLDDLPESPLSQQFPEIVEKESIPVLQAKSDNQVSAELMPAAYSNQGYKLVKNGVIDWYNGYIETTAFGTADIKQITNPVQAEIVAEKSARAMAFSQISEVLGGVQITQSSTYQDLLLKVDNLVVESKSFIRNAHVIESKIEWIKEVPKATVKLRVPLYGNNSVSAIVAPYINELTDDVTRDEILGHQKAQISDLKQYTGFVLDARNSNYQPALRVDLKARGSSIDRDSNIASVRNLRAGYYPAMQELKDNPDVGDNPFIIVADPTSQKGQIIVDPEIMQQIITLLSTRNTIDSLAVLY